MDRLHFYSPEAFERWDWRNPDNPGIGGSETAHVEMAWRTARRGYKVTSYSPLPLDCPDRNWRGVEWKDVAEADFGEPGLWILSRCPQVLDNFTPGRTDQQTWLICQDEDYVGKWTEERQRTLTRCVALCLAQAEQFAERYPLLRGKIGLNSNGLKPEYVERVLAEKHTRNPKRIMYASSPDRALVPALAIFARVREFVPDAEFHVFYGFDNIDKLVESVEKRPSVDAKSKQFLDYVRDLKAGLKQPGVVVHGRTGQLDLYREWAKSAIWLYPNARFRETSCITCMEAQAMGTVPVFSPLWAVHENTRHGIAIEGDYADPLTVARFAANCVALIQQPEQAEAIRAEMMPEARRLFTYERFCDRYEADIHGYVNGTRATEQQHAFHLRHAAGRVLNVGCNDDAGELGRLGVNVDVMSGKDPWTGRTIKADVVADARNLPHSLHGNFDTVVLSDILEHFQDSGAIQALSEAALCLRQGGKITVTCPEDYSDYTKHAGFTTGQAYTNGVYAYHWRPCVKAIMDDWFKRSGLKVQFYRPIDYGFAWGHGFVLGKGE